MTKKIYKNCEIHFSDGLSSEISELLNSGCLREGPLVKQFEERIQQRTGAKHVVATSSGTASLQLAYQALLSAGDEVLVPSFTFVATASMVVSVGATPIFCDVNPLTWVLDVEDVKRKISSKTKAIAGVHLFGNACDMNALKKIADEYDLKLIWDAAQAFGTRYEGLDVASIGDISCFSFYPSKNLTTGEGGLLATNDDDLAYRLRYTKSHGETQRYYHEMIGFNFRMTDIAAAIGMDQLEKFDASLEQRKVIAEQYNNYFSQKARVNSQVITPGCESSYNYFSVILDLDHLNVSRDEFIALLRERGVECGVHYPRPLHLQPCFGSQGDVPLPVSESLSTSILALPMHPYLSDADVEGILAEFDQVLSSQ